MELLQQLNAAKMTHATRDGIGMDILIISTSNLQLVNYWQSYLESKRGHLFKPSAHIITVEEDWPGGAGNGLGSLYAYQKATEKGRRELNIDIIEEQKKGASVAIYHTAGKGTRLSPLTAAEYSNKPAVKLPAPDFPGSSEALTVLEAVIKQTALYATSRKGRLSVFWGDQVFIPSKSIEYLPSHSVDILVKWIDMPTENDWRSWNLEHYGLMLLTEDGSIHATDKSSFAEITELAKEGLIDLRKGVGLSLGSFSLSLNMLKALLKEFDNELEQKTAKMDSDPYIWMPTTLSLTSYLKAMERKGLSLPEAERHYRRMQLFKNNFSKANSISEYFGTVDIGKASYWWDYGNLQSYVENNRKLLSHTAEAKTMRTFLELEEPTSQGCLTNCQIDSGNIQDCVLFNVQAKVLNIRNSLLLNTTITSCKGDGLLLYQVVEHMPLELPLDTVRADLFLPPSFPHIVLMTEKGRDGKEDWEVKLPQNSLSYSEVAELCSKTNEIF